ncbi:MAG: DUF4834 family protein [Chitinophagales bacterium]|nr:DUF4834 family protein [Chitinophagales bacterium]
MLKFLLFALIGYFVFSRLFGRVVFIKSYKHFDNRRDSSYDTQRENTTIRNTEIEKPKKVNDDEGEYIDFEEIK